jgi:hypothetical protein
MSHWETLDPGFRRIRPIKCEESEVAMFLVEMKMWVPRVGNYTLLDKMDTLGGLPIIDESVHPSSEPTSTTGTEILVTQQLLLLTHSASNPRALGSGDQGDTDDSMHPEFPETKLVGGNRRPVDELAVAWAGSGARRASAKPGAIYHLGECRGESVGELNFCSRPHIEQIS